MSDFNTILKRFLHDPIDKPFDFKTHEQRAKEYAEILGVSGVEDAKGSDWIASCMERSLLPKDIRHEFNEIKHHLSEGVIAESELHSEKLDFEKIKEVFKEIEGELNSSDEKKKFLYLWRNLQEKIVENIDSKWKKFIPLLPADTRIPDHSIWEHLKITSAINAIENLQNNSLFLFTIGPVQSFISQARKTQDLYMGSFLLSYLTFIGITVFIEKFGPTCIIYPDLFGQPLTDWYLEKKVKISVKKSSSKFITLPTIPNRFVAIIPEYDEKEIKELAENVSKRVREEWQNIRTSIIEFLKEKNIKISEEFNKKFESQISDFPEIYWTAVPWRIGDRDLNIQDLNPVIIQDEIQKWKNFWEFANDNGKYPPNIGLLYGLIYTVLEKSIGARKNLRDFEQFSVEEKGRKCSLCGEKDVLVFNETKNKNKFNRFEVPLIDLTETISDGKIPPKYLTNGEGLCGVCFIKRALELYLEKEVDEIFKDISFPSTAEIACADFKEKAFKDDKSKELFKEYIDDFKKVTGNKFPETDPLPKLKSKIEKKISNLEGEWFFEEILTKKAIEKYIWVEKIDEDKVRRLQEKLKKLTEKIGQPNPYYAVIMLDGDNMGKWLSGEKLPDIQHAYHQEVWEKLQKVKTKDDEKTFAEALKEIVSKKPITPEIHASISSALRNYSLEFVRKIVEEEHLGKLVYAGGDDVLAFVNLKDLFEVMRKLRAAFSGQIKFNDDKEIEIDWKNKTGFVEKDERYYLTMGKNATASMGVVIAHYKMPLKIVLDKVREMENFAKDDPGKDSFAIGFCKHSGEAKIIRYKWRYEDMDTVESMMKLRKYFTKKEKEPWISKSFIYNLSNVFANVKERNGHFPLSGSIFKSELSRLAKRALQNVKSTQKKEIVNQILEQTKIKDIFWNSGANINYLVYLLEVCAFISSGEEDK